MKDYANMPDREFARVDTTELQEEFEKAHRAVRDALGREPEEIDPEEVKRACDWACAASAAVSRKHRRWAHRP